MNLEDLLGIGDFGLRGLNTLMQFGANRKNEQLMREGWERDDSAMQRRVADYEAAGLNKVLAAGGSPMGSDAIKVEAPQINNKLMDLMQGKLLRQQMAKTDAELKRLSIETEKAKAERDMRNAERNYSVRYWQRRSEYADQTANSDVERNNKEAGLVSMQYDLNKWLRELQFRDIDIKKKWQNLGFASDFNGSSIISTLGGLLGRAIK